MGPNMQETVTVACIMNCPTINIHTGKHYKALINSGATISLLWYSTYQNIEDSFKTPKQPTTAKLNTANSSPMTALGITALHLRIVNSNSHTILWFVIGYQIQKLFLDRYSEEVFHFHALGQREELLYTKRWKILNIYKKLWTEGHNWHS